MVISMKIFIDKEACIGCGLCAGICPSVFSMNNTGKSEVNKGVKDSDIENAKEAAEACPVNAIKIK